MTATPGIRRSRMLPYILSFAATLVMTALLFAQGRIWWCKFRDIRPYVHEAWGSSHTSQHFSDPYTFTHILHGVLLFWLTGLIFANLPGAWRFFVAVLTEAAWEVLENTNYIIEKYRENTASLDYFGDSILNSVGDVLACGVGFAIALRIGHWPSLVFFVFVELVLLTFMRDSLMLNILMLIYSFESVKQWQTGL